MPGATAKFINEFLKNQDVSGISQRIRNLEITPQPNAILFHFTTAQLTVPVIEIFLLAQTANGTILFLPQNLVTVKFDFLSALVGNHFTDHKGRIDGLAQDTSYCFRITAGNGALPAAIATGTFKTGRRSAAFVIRDILVFNDGDPGAKGAGELEFGFGFYNEAGDRVSMSDELNYYDNNLSSGKVVDLPFGTQPAFQTNHASDWMAVYVRGQEDDHFFTPFHNWITAPIKLPESAVHFENDDIVVADAFQYIQLPNNHGNHRVNFSLDSGPWGIHYIVTGWADILVTDPVVLPNIPKSTKSLQTGWTPRQWGTLISIGQRVRIEHPDGKRSVMALGPNGLLALRLSAGKFHRNHDWKMIEKSGIDTAALVATEASLVIFAVSAGIVKYRVEPIGENKTATEWHEIGYDFQPLLSAIVWMHDTIVLTALGQDACLYGMLLPCDLMEGTWIKLGGNFAGSVVVVPGRRSVDLFGLTSEGNVLTAEWHPESQEELSWQSLEGEPFIYIYAGEEDTSTHVIGLTAERRVFSISREDDQWTSGWISLGTLDDVNMEEAETTT